MTTKVCPGCQREFPLTGVYFYRRASEQDGFHRKCKECEGHRFILQDPEGYRTCNVCGKVLPLTEEYFRKRGTTDRGGFRPECRKCSNDRDRAYYVNHLEKFKQYRKENREHKQVYQQQYIKEYFKTPTGRQAHAAAYKRYLQTAKGKLVGRLGTQRRRAKVAQSLINFTLQDWERCLIAFDHCCAYCGESAPVLSQDHVVPLTQGGHYTPDNIVPACRSCNSRKFNHEFAAWYCKQSFFSAERAERIIQYLALQATSEAEA